METFFTASRRRFLVSDDMPLLRLLGLFIKEITLVVCLCCVSCVRLQNIGPRTSDISLTALAKRGKTLVADTLHDQLREKVWTTACQNKKILRPKVGSDFSDAKDVEQPFPHGTRYPNRPDRPGAARRVGPKGS